MKKLPPVIFPLLLLLFPSIALAEATAEEREFSQAELDQLLAPIALYPDALLAQILTASTYPLEIVEAARWSKANPELEGTEAVDAVADQKWDPSVMALVAFPPVLERMDEDLGWTRRLGDAFLMQEEDVMASVQGLRERAYQAGHLDSLEHLEVRREREVIVIEPANPQIIYVPYYRPTVVYGTWGWPAYPPVYWGPPASYYSVYYSTGRTRVVWTSGVVVRSGFFFTTCDWHRRQVVVVNHHHYHSPTVVHRQPRSDWSRYDSAERWQHQPTHRRGVTYRTDTLNERYGRSSASTSGERSDRWERYSAARAPAPTTSRDQREHENVRRETGPRGTAPSAARANSGWTDRTSTASQRATPPRAVPPAAERQQQRRWDTPPPAPRTAPPPSPEAAPTPPNPRGSRGGQGWSERGGTRESPERQPREARRHDSPQPRPSERPERAERRQTREAGVEPAANARQERSAERPQRADSVRPERESGRGEGRNRR